MTPMLQCKCWQLGCTVRNALENVLVLGKLSLKD